MEIMRPRTALYNLLFQKGIDCIVDWSPSSRSRLRELGLQAVGLEMLVHERNVCRQRIPSGMRIIGIDDGVKLGVPQRDGIKCHYTIGWRRCDRLVVSWRELLSMLPSPPLPAFVVDLGLLGKHSDEERARLKVQLGITLNVIRMYLWDPHLILTSTPENVRNWLFDVMGNAKVNISREKPGRILWSMGADKVIILRPDASNPLSEDEVRQADAFIIGGIVDRIPRPGVSRYLDASVPWGEPRKILLRGSLLGVPERINRIVEIILKILIDNMSLEEAIVSSMTKRDIQRRLIVEIMRASRGKIGPTKTHFEALRRWLPITCEDYIQAAKKARVRLGWKCEGKDNS